MTLELESGASEILLQLTFELMPQKHLIDEKNYLSFQYGPLLLAHDTHLGDALWTAVSADATPHWENPRGRWLVQFLYDGIDLVDFASAGGNRPGEDEYTVFIPEK